MKELDDVVEARSNLYRAKDRLREANAKLAEALAIDPGLVWTGAISFNFSGVLRYVETNKL